MRPILMKRVSCAACSQLVNIPAEGSEDLGGVLCHLHKNEVAFLHQQLQNKSQLEQDFRQANQTLKNSLGLQELEKKEQQSQIRALETQLTEQDQKIEQVKQKLGKWTQLITNHHE